eukprot:m.71062 g.71062  ORF g.71062 m.71062 type:complete len:63 (-) comp16069_c0_seq3:96-284(-)
MCRIIQHAQPLDNVENKTTKKARKETSATRLFGKWCHSAVNVMEASNRLDQDALCHRHSTSS